MPKAIAAISPKYLLYMRTTVLFLAFSYAIVCSTGGRCKRWLVRPAKKGWTDTVSSITLKVPASKMETAKLAKDKLPAYELDDVRDASADAATFYVWITNLEIFMFRGMLAMLCFHSSRIAWESGWYPWPSPPKVTFAIVRSKPYNLSDLKLVSVHQLFAFTLCWPIRIKCTFTLITI